MFKTLILLVVFLASAFLIAQRELAFLSFKNTSLPFISDDQTESETDEPQEEAHGAIIHDSSSSVQINGVSDEQENETQQNIGDPNTYYDSSTDWPDEEEPTPTPYTYEPLPDYTNLGAWYDFYNNLYDTDYYNYPQGSSQTEDSYNYPSYATPTPSYSYPSYDYDDSPTTTIFGGSGSCSTYDQSWGSTTYCDDGTSYNSYDQSWGTSTYGSDGSSYNSYDQSWGTSTYGSNGDNYNTYDQSWGSSTYGSDGNSWNTYDQSWGTSTYGSDGSNYNTYDQSWGTSTYSSGY